MIPNGVVVVANGRQPDGRQRRPAVAALEHVANRPIICHVLDALGAADVDHVFVVGSADALGVVQECLRGYAPAPLKSLQFRVSDNGGGVAGALKAATPLVNGGPCIVHLAEGLLDEPLAPLLSVLEDSPSDVLLLVQRDREHTGRGNGALHAVSSLASSNVRNPLGPASIGFFATGSLHAVGEADLSDDLTDLTPVGKRLAETGARVQVRGVDVWRGYAGNPTDLLELNRVALDSLATHVPPGLRATNRIEGRVRIDRTASVTSSVIVGPAIIGSGAEVTNAYIGPYTSIGARARIEGAEIERSIVYPEASVMHVGGRLESSVIGPHARVFRDFSVPRAMRLRVSEGDEVAFC